MTNSETGEGRQKLLASACNLTKNNCEKKQLKIYLLPQLKMREKKDI